MLDKAKLIHALQSDVDTLIDRRSSDEIKSVLLSSVISAIESGNYDVVPEEQKAVLDTIITDVPVKELQDVNSN